MGEIINILMRRDGLSRTEAENIIEECQEDVMECVYKGDYFGAEDAIAYHLGLEPDYLMYFI